MNHRPRSIVFACLCLLILAGCGFHPRGELRVPADIGPVRIVSGDPYSPLALALSRALTRAHAAPADASDASAGAASLHIVSEAWNQQPLSINVHAQATEYDVTYVVKYEFTAADGKSIAPVREVRIERNFSYNASNALGSAQEQQTIREEMQRDMAAAIMRQLDIILRKLH